MEKLIPKIIHYCWFGNNDMPESHIAYIEEWKQILSDYKFIKWDETNSPMHLNYMQQAYQVKNWANMSNLTRLHAVYNFGGIYLDTDVKVLKSLDNLLNQICFFGFESQQDSKQFSVNNAIFGAVPKFEFIKELKTALLMNFQGLESANLSSPELVTNALLEKGLINYEEQTIGNIKIYPHEYFYPFSWNQEYDSGCIKKETYVVHFWADSWSKQGKIETTDSNRKLNFFSGIRSKAIKCFKQWILRKRNFANEVSHDVNQQRIKDIFDPPIVRNGIFKGLKYSQLKAHGSSIYPKLLGTYENQLNPYIYDLMDNKYEKIINIGCGEGYFALGLAKLFPNVQIDAYDTSEEAIALCNENIVINQLVNQVFTYQQDFSALSINKLKEDKKYFIFCDCEGCENEVFNESSVTKLKYSDLIIELHEFILPNLKTKIKSIFGHTHEILFVQESTKLDMLVGQQYLKNINFEDIYTMIDENRPEKMVWAIINPKQK